MKSLTIRKKKTLMSPEAVKKLVKKRVMRNIISMQTERITELSEIKTNHEKSIDDYRSENDRLREGLDSNTKSLK